MSKLYHYCSLFILSLCLIMPASGAERGEFYFIPGIQWGEFDDGLDDDWGYSVGFGLQITDRIAAELSSFDLDTKDSLGIKSDVDHFKLDLLYDLDAANPRLTPFIVGGLGHLNFAGENDTLFDIGAGIKYEVTNNLEWRTTIRKFEYFGRSNGELDWGIDTGLVFYFGGASTRPASRPSTPVATTPVPPAEVPPSDRDGDGVPDNRDDCPDTPRTYAVDANGCPIPVEEIARIELLVNFDFDRSEVKPEYFAEIEEVADFMRRFPEVIAELEGHTDGVGTVEYNQGLSERRANAVRDVLIDRYSIPASRISAVGFGENQPVASNDTAAGRAQNRRVITVIIRAEQNYQAR